MANLDTSRFEAGLKRWKEAYMAAARKGLGQAAAQLMNDCIMEAPAVPIDTGTLRGSGSYFVNGELGGTSESMAHGGEANPTPARDDRNLGTDGKVVARVGFSTPYAARVHEHPMNFQDPDAGNKYLEAKLQAHGKEYIEVAAQIAKRETGM